MAAKKKTSNRIQITLDNTPNEETSKITNENKTSQTFNLSSPTYPPNDTFEPSKVIVFDIKASNAHFRNIQTNSSSLSYYFPPPTTLAGMIAAIIGLKYDSYYEILSVFNAFYAVEVLTPLRKELHTVNYRVYKENGYTQIPVELIFPKDGNEIVYRVYFSVNDNNLYQKILNSIREQKYIYPPYLGLASCLCAISFVGEYETKQVIENEVIGIKSVIRSGTFDIVDSGSSIILFPEYMRRYFLGNRIPGQMQQYFFIAQGSLKVKTKESKQFYQITLNEEKINLGRL